MPREGIDYAWHHGVDTDAFRRGGATFVVRYVSHDETQEPERERGAAAERRGLRSRGRLGVDAVPRSGGQGGRRADAHTAADAGEGVRDAGERPVYFAVDFDAGDDDLPLVVDYLHGAASVLGPRRVGVYGGYRVVGHCLDQKVVGFGWQTYAWSAGRRDPRAQLYQHRNGVVIGGVSCDRDTAFAADFGQWRVQAAKAPAFPYPPTDYLGTARPDPHCHSGTDPIERQAHRALAEEDGRARLADRRNRRLQPAVGAGLHRVPERRKGSGRDGLVGPITWKATWTAPVT